MLGRLFPYALWLLSAVLLVWGALGLLEYVSPKISLGLSNPRFPPGMQFLHFLALFTTGTIFSVGYWLRWFPTPFATIVMYAVLATLCFIETIDFDAFGSGPTRFIPMAVEYAAYVALSAYLLRSETIEQHFARQSS